MTISDSQNPTSVFEYAGAASAFTSDTPFVGRDYEDAQHDIGLAFSMELFTSVTSADLTLTEFAAYSTPDFAIYGQLSSTDPSASAYYSTGLTTANITGTYSTTTSYNVKAIVDELLATNGATDTFYFVIKSTETSTDTMASIDGPACVLALEGSGAPSVTGSGGITFAGAATADYEIVLPPITDVPSTVKDYINGNTNCGYWKFETDFNDSSSNGYTSSLFNTGGGADPAIQSNVNIANFGGRPHAFNERPLSGITYFQANTMNVNVRGTFGTLFGWFHVDSSESAAQSFFINLNKWRIERFNGTTYRILYTNQAESDVTTNFSLATLDDGWHFIVFEKTGFNINLYVDDALVATRNGGLDLEADTGNVLRIGGVEMAYQEVGFIRGRILTSGERSALYNSGAGTQWGYASAIGSQTGSGGITFAGDSGTNLAINQNGSGGIAYAGQATVSVLLSEYSFNASGGINYSGQATASTDNRQVASGGIVYAGTASFTVDYDTSTTGGIAFAASAPFAISYNATGSGGVVYGGKAQYPPDYFYPDPQGGIIHSGAASFSVDYNASGTGGITFAGSGSGNQTYNAPAPTGGVAFAGAATAEISGYNYNASGGISYGGGAVSQQSWNYASGAAVFSNGYQYRQRLTAPTLKTFTDFPVKIETTLDTAKVQANGYDIAAFSTTENALAFQLERYDSTTGEAVLWASMDSTDDTENAFYLYYGKTVESDQSTDNAFAAFSNVYHLAESGNGTAGEYIDSAGSLDGRGGNGLASAVPTQASGKHGYAQTFDGGDYISTSSDGIPANSDLSVSLWLYPTDPTYLLKRSAFSRGKGGNWAFEVGQDSQGRPYAAIQSNTSTVVETFGSTALTKNTWHHLAAVWDSGTRLTLYANGVQVAQMLTSVSTLADATAGNEIGKRGSFYYRGRIDELRVVASALSADWIAAEYSTPVEAGRVENPISHNGAASFTVDYNASPAGGIAYAGGAVIDSTGTYGVVGSGGLTISGDSTSAPAISRTGSGGVSFTATAAVGVTFDHTPAGGIVFAGAAAAETSASQTPAGGVVFAGAGSAIVAIGYTATGGIGFAGAASANSTLAASASGGVVFASTAAAGVSLGYSGGGVLALSGAATLSNSYTFEPSGGISYGGAATVAEENSYTATGSGGVALGNSAPFTVDYNQTPAGGIVFAGAAAADTSASQNPAGGVIYSGAATVSPAISRTASGVLAFNGGALFDHAQDYQPTGGVAFGASAPFTVDYISTPAGGISYGGGVIFRQWQGSGGIAFAGAINPTRSLNYTGSGGLSFNQVATVGGLSGFITLPAAISGAITLGKQFSRRGR